VWTWRQEAAGSWSDAYWAINRRAEFKKAVKAMITSAMEQSDP
jgi:hypothetical protein